MKPDAAACLGSTHWLHDKGSCRSDVFCSLGAGLSHWYHLSLSVSSRATGLEPVANHDTFAFLCAQHYPSAFVYDVFSSHVCVQNPHGQCCFHQACDGESRGSGSTHTHQWHSVRLDRTVYVEPECGSHHLERFTNTLTAHRPCNKTGTTQEQLLHCHQVQQQAHALRVCRVALTHDPEHLAQVFLETSVRQQLDSRAQWRFASTWTAPPWTNKDTA